MAGLLDILPGTSTQPAAVRRPTFAVHFGPPSGGGGGLLEAAGSALGLTTGGDDPWVAALVAIRIESYSAPGVDIAVLDLANEARAPSVALGDPGSIELGYGDGDNVLVFTGQVDAIRTSLAGATRITLVNSSAALARRRIDQSYQQQSAGAIVNDLIGQCGVDAADVEDGSDYPFYVVDAARTVYQHIARLAQRSGYIAAITAEDKLQFAPAAADNAAQTFTYAQDLLAVHLAEGAPLAGVTFTGEGAAGSQGSDAWSWLIKDAAAVQKSAGDASGARPLVDAALRSGAALETAAAAYLAEQGGSAGRLIVPGAPDVTVGAAVEITGAPQDALNGLHLVTRLRHRYDKARGFVTELALRRAGESASGLGGLAALAGGLL
ncbi:MAG: hypothetical protein DCC57_10955 [Chloroflexi bacterium]|nr:MAG: hypothetical protein DCC57_10955 [Chloroflexota bacterium]